MRGIKLGLWALFTLSVIAVAVALVNQNSEPTSIALFSYVSDPMPKYLLLIATFILGALFASLFFVVELIVLEARCVRFKRLNQKLERAVAKSELSLSPSGGPAVPSKSPNVDHLSLADDNDDV